MFKICEFSHSEFQLGGFFSSLLIGPLDRLIIKNEGRKEHKIYPNTVNMMNGCLRPVLAADSQINI